VLGEELGAGLSTWTGSYPDWKHPVNSFARRSAAELVLVDPLLEDEQWPGLERLAGSRQVHVVLTIHWHARSAAAVVERFAGVRVWAHSRNRAAIARRVEPTDVFAAGEELPGGLVPFTARPRSEVVLWDPAHRALIAGDALLGDGEEGARLRLSPASWLPQSTDHDDLRAALRPLLDLPVEQVLVSHGAPLVPDSAAELRRVLS
jgi:glyoxylase-like metal-dependent hydrolase (beta-lactamase superfamily II)